MNINDFIKIVQENYNSNLNVTSDDFVAFCVHRLIQETDLSFNFSSTYLCTMATDNLIGLIGFNDQNSKDSSVFLSEYTRGTNYESFNMHDNYLKKNYPLILNSQQVGLVERFNDVVQNMESFNDINKAFTFDDITQLKHIMPLKKSTLLPFYITSNTENKFESSHYNAIKKTNSIYINNSLENLHDISPSFNFYSNDVISKILYKNKNDKILFNFDDFDCLTHAAQRKLLQTAGLQHALIDDVAFDTLVQNDEFTENNFMGRLAVSNSLSEMIIGYFDSMELEDIKFEIEMATDLVKSHPTLEKILSNNVALKEAIDNCISIAFDKYPTLNYKVQNISIIKDIELIHKGENSLLPIIDTFNFTHNLGNLAEINNNGDLSIFLSQFRLYGMDSITNLDLQPIKSYDTESEESIRFITANQFNANGILSAKIFRADDTHHHLKIKSVIIDPCLPKKAINELIESTFEYAKKHSLILDFDLPETFKYGNLAKDDFIDMLQVFRHSYKDSVVCIADFGGIDFISNNKSTIQIESLVNSYMFMAKKADFSYAELIKAKPLLENIHLENIKSQSSHIERKMDKLMESLKGDKNLLKHQKPV